VSRKLRVTRRGVTIKNMTIFKQKVGKHGEDLAQKFLCQNGYKILEKNFRSSFGEIDIIAQEKKTFCFVEVKTRHSQIFGSPSEAVSFQKQEKIIKTALFYMNKKKLDNKDMRFDVVSIFLDGKEQILNIEIIKNAFEGAQF